MKSQYLKILILLLLVSFIFFFGHKNYKQLSDKSIYPFVLIPTNASIILQVNDMNDFSKKLNESEIWGKCILSKYGKSLQSDIYYLDSLILIINQSKKTKINTVLFSTHKSSYNDAAILFSTTPSKSINLKDFMVNILQIKKEEIETLSYENENIYELNRKTKKYFIAEKEGMFFGSSSKILVQDAIRQFGAKSNLLSNSAFIKVQNTVNNNAIANLYYNFNNLLDLSTIYSHGKQNKSIFLNHFSSWAATDIFIKNNSFFANGLSDVGSGSDIFLTALKNQKSSSHNVYEILPHNTSFVFELCISNAKLFADKKNTFLQRHNAFYPWEKKKKYHEENYNFEINEFLKYVDNEIGVFKIESTTKDDSEQSYSFIKVTDIQQSSIFLSGLVNTNLKSEYDGLSIFNIAEPKLIPFLFGDIFSVSDNSYFVAIEDYLIFGNSSAALEYMIDNYSSKNTLSSSKHFKKFQQQIASRANLFFYINPGKSADLLSNTLNKKWEDLFTINKDSLQKFTAFAFQMNAGSTLFLNNIILFYDKDFKEELKQEWYGQLDTTFAIKPQIIYNYITKKEQVFVQDKNNKIYLFSTNGEKLWEEKIQERILGEVSQIDFYKNKKLQILFNTKSKLYIFDRLGRIVENFPKKLPSNATNGHATFDYNNNRNYRILIAAEDGKLYNFDKKGHEINGWNFKEKNSTITENAQHFVVGSKDYILYPAKDKNLSLLARDGKERVSYNNIPEFNKQSLQVDKNGMIYGITNEGKLWRGKLDGNATKIPVTNLNANSKFLLYDNKFIYSSDKTIFVIDEKFDLLHSFELNNTIQEITTFKNIIVVITSKEIYLWKDGQIMKGTPIETDRFTSVCDLDKDGKTNVIISRGTFLYNFEIE
jgi:hypothetical protein